MVRFRDPTSIATTNRLTLDSIQDALRLYFQPVKNDDPQLDFYTIYERETVGYDTEYIKRCNEDLKNTLLFVRFCVPLMTSATLTTFPGWFVLCGQLRLRHRHPAKARAGP